MNPFSLNEGIVRDSPHVRVRRLPPRSGIAESRASFEKTFAPSFGYWTERELSFFRMFGYHELKRVVQAQRIDLMASDEPAGKGAASVSTQDAGLTIEDWLAIRPRYGGNQVLDHPFQSAYSFIQLTRSCLLSLQEIHTCGVIHCDLKGDNICLPYSPYPYVPDIGTPVTMNFEQLRLIDFAFSIDRNKALREPLPVAGSMSYQSVELRDALSTSQRENTTDALQELTPRVDLHSLGVMLKDIAETGIRAEGVHEKLAFSQMLTVIDEVHREGRRGGAIGWSEANNAYVSWLGRCDAALSLIGSAENFRSFLVESVANAPFVATPITPLINVPISGDRSSHEFFGAGNIASEYRRSGLYTPLTSDLLSASKQVEHTKSGEESAASHDLGGAVVPNLAVLHTLGASREALRSAQSDASGIPGDSPLTRRTNSTARPLYPRRSSEDKSPSARKQLAVFASIVRATRARRWPVVTVGVVLTALSIGALSGVTELVASIWNAVRATSDDKPKSVSSSASGVSTAGHSDVRRQTVAKSSQAVPLLPAERSASPSPPPSLAVVNNKPTEVKPPPELDSLTDDSNNSARPTTFLPEPTTHRGIGSSVDNNDTNSRKDPILRPTPMGLGRLSVYSSLGQPIDASIEIRPGIRTELKDVQFRIATAEQYRSFGIDYPKFAEQIRVSMRLRSDGTLIGELRSSASHHDPFLDLLLELKTTEGRILREYVVLLEPGRGKGK